MISNLNLFECQSQIPRVDGTVPSFQYVDNSVYQPAYFVVWHSDLNQ